MNCFRCHFIIVSTVRPRFNSIMALATFIALFVTLLTPIINNDNQLKSIPISISEIRLIEICCKQASCSIQSPPKRAAENSKVDPRVFAQPIKCQIGMPYMYVSRWGFNKHDNSQHINLSSMIHVLFDINTVILQCLLLFHSVNNAVLTFIMGPLNNLRILNNNAPICNILLVLCCVAGIFQWTHLCFLFFFKTKLCSRKRCVFNKQPNNNSANYTVDQHALQVVRQMKG